MNGNKGARILNRIFQIVFFICMSVTFVGVIVTGYKSLVDNKTYYSAKTHVLIYVSAVLLAVSFCFLYWLTRRDYKLLHREGKMSSEKKFRVILFSAFGILLIVQLFIGAKTKINPVYDLKAVDMFASSYAKTGSFDYVRELIASGKNDYLARYPNNFTIMMILAVFYRMAYLVFGYIPRMLPTVMNVFAINLSMLFTVLIAKQIWGRRRALFVLCLLVLFAPYYSYIPFYYTDTLSMPFGMLGLYLYVLALKTDDAHKVRKYVMLVISGMVIFVGFKVKGSLIVVIAAAVIYAFLKCKWKEFACVALALILGFGSFFAAFNVGYNAVGLVSEEQAEQLEYPYTHWVMMGLKGIGGYNRGDSRFTSAIEGKENKQEANVEVIKERLKTYLDEHKLTDHFVKKSIWMWGDGTYYIHGHIFNYVKRSFLHEFFLPDGKYYNLFYVYSNAYQLVLLLMMALSLLSGAIKPKIDFSVLLKMIIFGIFVFLLIWEGRSRYLFNLTPVFIMIAADGVAVTTDTIRQRINRRRSQLTESAATPEIESESEAVEAE